MARARLKPPALFTRGNKKARAITIVTVVVITVIISKPMLGISRTR